jgi:hypothetical protein
MKDKLITWLILVGLMIISIIPGFAQTPSIDITGNLVNNTQTATATTSTWQNVVFDTELKCWAPGDAGYCGPQPIVRPSGDINFSYGTADIYQRVNVAKALASTGLVTTGFVFTWQSKNGNGWDDGRLDQLDAYVKLYNTGDSKVIEQFNYNLNTVHDWTTYTWNQNWTNTKIGYRGSDVGNVQFGFVGRDNNYWAGPYGPEVNNISFQLKYKPDPCKNNPLFSPECPKFQEELAKATATPTTEKLDQPQQNESFQESRDGSRDRHDPEIGRDDPYEEGVDYGSLGVEIGLTKIFTAQIKQEERSVEIAQEAVEQTEKVSEQTTKQAELIARDSQQRSIRDNEQSQIDGQVQQNRNQESILALFQGPSLSSNDRAFKPPTALQQTLDVFQQKDIGQPEQQARQIVVQQQQAENILASIYKNNQEQQSLNLNTTSILQNNSLTIYNVSVIKTEDIFVQPVQNTEQQQLAISLPRAVLPNMQPLTEQITVQQPILQLNLPEIKSVQTEAPETPQVITSFLTNRADPINQVLENKTVITSEQQETKVANIKQNVQENDAAVGVSINSIAKTPLGFNSYLVALADVQFYPSKEIYRNQRVVDNQRALRQLSSDKLHQEMIELQYRSR